MKGALLLTVMESMNKSPASGNIMTLDARSFDEATSSGIALVDFWAPWCGPCQMQTPTLEDLASRVGGQAAIAKVNVDEAPELAARFDVRSIPTLILLKDGNVVRQFVGVQPQPVLAKAVMEVATRQPPFFRAMSRLKTKPGCPAVPGSARVPVRILLVHQDDCAFVCLWHLSALFDDVCKECRQEWHSCLYADLQEPELALAAADQARQADLVVFCQAGAEELPPDVKQWTAGWITAKRGQGAAIGGVIPCSRAGLGSSKTGAFLDEMARKGSMTFLGVRQYALQSQNRPTGARAKRTASLSETLSRSSMRTTAA